MNRFGLLTLLVACVVALLGCAGNDNSAQAWRGETPFTGSWIGVWTSPGVSGNDSEGTLAMTVAKDSVILGSMTGTKGTGVVSGNVTSNGEFNLTVTYGNSVPNDSLHGFAGLDSATHQFSGDGTRIIDGTSHPFHFTQGSATDQKFVGAWTGTWTAPGVAGTDVKGSVYLTVGSGLAVSGSFSSPAKGTGVITGNIGLSGEFTFTVNYSEGTPPDSLHGYASVANVSVNNVVVTVFAADGTRNAGSVATPFHLALTPTLPTAGSQLRPVG